MQQQTDDTASASLEIRPALSKSKQHTGGDSTSVFQLKRKSVVEQARAYHPPASDMRRVAKLGSMAPNPGPIHIWS